MNIQSYQMRFKQPSNVCQSLPRCSMTLMFNMRNMYMKLQYNRLNRITKSPETMRVKKYMLDSDNASESSVNNLNECNNVDRHTKMVCRRFKNLKSRNVNEISVLYKVDQDFSEHPNKMQELMFKQYARQLLKNRPTKSEVRKFKF